ncbi:MAG: chromosome segregation ATPase [Flavobacteriales bacterium]|jgi:chromosome segregation ATPase
MGNTNTVVEQIKSKIELLASEKKELKSDVIQLQQAIGQLQSIVSAKEVELEELNQKYKVLKMAKSLEGGEVENNKDIKLKINEMVREIDKCIGLLNK